MNGTPHDNRSSSCDRFGSLFQDYLDGSLPKTVSLELFLHLRECASCESRLNEMKQVFRLLDSIPAVAVPPEFDARILKAVPYEAYRRMEPLRRDRVPVFLEEDFLPAPIRAAVTRWAGGIVAALAAAGLALSWLPDSAMVVVAGGLMPEALVRLQRVARKLTPSGQRSTSG